MLRQFHLSLFDVVVVVVVVVAVTMIEAMDPPEATEPTTIPDEFLIVAETTSLRLVTPNGSLVRTIENTQTQRVVGVAHNVDTQTIFWTDISLEAIVTSNVDGTNVRTIVSRLVIPSGVAYDPSAKHVYFSDSSLDVIGVATLDGNYSVPLISTDLVEPRAIILQPSMGLMYWIDSGSKAKIERAFMSGNNRTALIEGYDLGWPYGLTISGERLYWIDGKADKMESSDLNGNDRQVMLTFSANIHPFGMAITSETIYFTDRYARVVYGLPMSSNLSESDLSVVTRTRSTPYGLSLYRAGENATVNRCSLNNGDCEQMCLAEPTGRMCACSVGVLNQDGVSCGEPDTVIFLVENDEIRGYVLRNGALQPAIAPITTVKRPISVAVDPTTELLYVSDITDRAIFEVTKDGQKRLVLDDPPLSYADNIAVDYVSKVLYYTDRTANIIGVVSVKGDWRKTLIGGLDEPRGLKLDIAEGMIYWSDWGSVPKIERVSMTGERRQVLVSTLIVWPNGITLDLAKRLLYWADARLDKIEVCNFDGTNRRLLGTYPQVHPYALDIYGDLLIWSDWQHNTVGSVNIDGSNFKVFFAPHVSFWRPTGLSVYNSSAPIATSACLGNDCSSDQVCVPENSTSYQCFCKFGNYNPSTEKCDQPVKNDADYKPTCDCVSTTLVCVLAVDVQLGGGGGANGDAAAYLVKPKVGVYATCLNRKSWENASVSAIGFVENSWNDGACSVSSKSFAVRQGFTESNLAERPCSLVSSSPTSPLDVKVVEHLYASSNGRLRRRAVDLSTLNKDTEDLRSGSCDCESEVLFRWLQGKAQTKTSNCTTKGNELLASIVIENDKCGLLRAPPRSRLSCSSSGRQETCSIQCDKGYVINGSISTAKQTCNPAVGWSPEELRCRLAY
ncbi:low-density lipoprotein receptor-related protein 5-like isoform X2 [Oscarella lobularis]|uniref:low-density lipoprotein receptor-related protein 5-like isoform X2 n=1 Tax=Oscarella lobularis TaxID=121494 RepID=UPI0033140C65